MANTLKLFNRFRAHGAYVVENRFGVHTIPWTIHTNKLSKNRELLLILSETITKNTLKTTPKNAIRQFGVGDTLIKSWPYASSGSALGGTIRFYSVVKPRNPETVPPVT